MSFTQEPVFLWLSQFAYQPQTVYIALIGMMFASAIGLPLPEEVTLISIGFLAFMGTHPQFFPPPYEGAPHVSPHIAAWLAFFAVFCSDVLIYGIGRLFGRRIVQHPRMKKIIPDSMLIRVEEWTQKYGVYACGIFRFTPGIRFPGHLACGMMKFPFWKFLLIDGFAALLSVPTQIYLIAYWGEPILKKLHQFKMILGGLLLAILIYFLARWIYKKIRTKPIQDV